MTLAINTYNYTPCKSSWMTPDSTEGKQRQELANKQDLRGHSESPDQRSLRMNCTWSTRLYTRGMFLVSTPGLVNSPHPCRVAMRIRDRVQNDSSKAPGI